MRIREIDALRGLAAFGVAAIFHSYLLLGTDHTSPLAILEPFAWLHRWGWTLVDLFFVISGFIFSHVYLERSGALKVGVTWQSFGLARFARLYPLHLVTLLAVAVIGLFRPMGQNDLWHFGLQLLFLQESGLNAGHSFNGPAWSLSIEAYCYVLFILIASRARLSVALLLSLVMLGLLLTFGQGESIVRVGRGLTGFFMGCLLWRRPWAVWVALPVALAVLFLYPPINRGAFFSLTLWPALVSLSLGLRALQGPAMTWLGDRSYSIYLVHMPIYYVLGMFDPSGLWAMAGATALVLVAADVSYRYLETPARRAIKSASLGREKRLRPFG